MKPQNQLGELLMKAYLLITTVALFVTSATPGWAQVPSESSSDQQGQRAVREAFPERVPISHGPKTVPPMPRSFGVAGAFQEGGNFHTLAPVTVGEITAADQAFEQQFGHVSPGRARVGMVRSITPASLLIDASSAVVTHLPDGQTLWTIAVRSPGAYGLRIHSTEFDVGEGSVLLYGKGRSELIVRGPYTRQGPNGQGDFWTPSLPGDTVYVEVKGVVDPQIEIAELLHLDRDPLGSGSGARGAGELPCHLDVMCEEDPPVSMLARDATGVMTFMSGGFASNCTGTLLTDLDDETIVPYFLTAYHCLSTQAQVDTLEVVWRWQNDACDETPPSQSDYDNLDRNFGGTLLAINPTSGGNDMAFIRLNGQVPAGVSLAGWTTADPDAAVGIHHPSLSWKRVTYMSDVGVCPACEFCGDGTDYDYYDQDNGLIEGGSSGSGVFNYSGQLAGQLLGTCCVISNCADGVYDCSEADEYTAQYGEFETTEPMIRWWLEVGGTIHVNGDAPSCADIPTCGFCGTPSEPYVTVNAANDCAWDGARIKIQAGSYPETLTFSKQLTLLASGGTVTIGG